MPWQTLYRKSCLTWQRLPGRVWSGPAVPTFTEEMKLAAAEAIAGLVDEKDLSDENILPEAFDPRVADVVSSAVKDHIRK